ncbi:hypothetical protein TNCV_1950251 [Trichonephila clavipes]|nr:hypothetical protein TNCV_1950251 [Trichonephila clavipes]
MASLQKSAESKRIVQELLNEFLVNKTVYTTAEPDTDARNMPDLLDHKPLSYKPESFGRKTSMRKFICPVSCYKHFLKELKTKYYADDPFTEVVNKSFIPVTFTPSRRGVTTNIPFTRMMSGVIYPKGVKEGGVAFSIFDRGGKTARANPAL